MTLIEQTEARLWLQQEFQRRREKNSSFSLRAFAQKLGLPSGRLSEILSNKRGLSLKTGQKIALALQMTPEERIQFLELIIQDKALTQASATLTEDLESIRFKQVATDQYYVLADWYHFAILSLMELKGFISRPRWIAQRLGISITETRGALERLERTGLIQQVKGNYVATHKNLATETDIQSDALRKSHRGLINLALNSLESDPMALREISAMTVAIDTKKLPEAKKKIYQFYKKLAKELEVGNKSEVYAINIQLFPLSHPLKKNS